MMKRFYLSLAAVGATAALLTAGSFALFTSSTSNLNNTFTTGTVSTTSTATTQVAFNNIAPGDSGAAGGLTVNYTGSLDAWLGISVTKSAGAIFASPLATSADGLIVTVSDGANTYAADGAVHVVGTTPVTSTTPAKTFTVSYSMPINAGNSYQNTTGSVTLAVKAVQSKNNPLSSTTGQPIWN